MPSVLVVIIFYVLLHIFPSAEFRFGQNEEASTQTEDHRNGSRIASYGRFFNQLCTRSISEPSFVCDYPYRDGSGIFPEHCCAQAVNPTEGNKYYYIYYIWKITKTCLILKYIHCNYVKLQLIAIIGIPYCFSS